MNLTSYPLLLRAGALLLLLGVTLTGCDAGTGKTPLVEAPPVEVFPTASYALSFEQTSITYSNLWPEGLAAEADAAKSGGDVEYMVDYEHTRETVVFDDEGYLSRTYEYVDGDMGTNLPGEVRADLEHLMPARSESDPVVRFEMSGGSMRYYTASGAVAHQVSYDPEAFRMQSKTLDDLRARVSEATTDAQQAERTLNTFQTAGVAVSESDGVFARINRSVNDMNGVARVEQVVDLRTGQPVQAVYYREDGRIDSSDLFHYNTFNGMPVMTNSVSLSYGPVNGAWDVAYRTEVNRTNVQTILR